MAKIPKNITMKLVVSNIDIFTELLVNFDDLLDLIPEYNKFEAQPILQRIKRNMRKMIEIKK